VSKRNQYNRFYIQTRCGLPTWVTVAVIERMSQAPAEIERLKLQDDPMWSQAEYRVTQNRCDRT
jgi:hypothetical protein